VKRVAPPRICEVCKRPVLTRKGKRCKNCEEAAKKSVKRKQEVLL